jgi:predicted ester cyclase
MQDHKVIVIERYYGALFSQGQIGLVDELVHEEYVNHSPSPGLPPGREGVRAIVTTLRAAFPDLSYVIEDLVVGTDAVATRTTLRGTQRGDLFGISSTGRRVEVAQMTIEHFREGRIVGHHRVTDELSLLRQLGAL